MDIWQASLVAELELRTSDTERYSTGRFSGASGEATRPLPAPSEGYSMSRPAGVDDSISYGSRALQSRPGEAAKPSPHPLPQSSPPSPRLQDSVQLFPAEVAVVYKLEDLVAAIDNQKRDIEIRSHLDLRKMPLKLHPGPRFLDGDDLAESKASSAGSDLAFLSWPTRSIRVCCFLAGIIMHDCA